MGWRAHVEAVKCILMASRGLKMEIPAKRSIPYEH